MSLFFIYKQNEFSKNQLNHQNQRINQQSQLIESTRKSNLIVLMNDIFDKIDIELKNSPKRTLSNNTIARIVALNHSFQPYRLLEGDSLSEKKWSPERGLLLIGLASMNMDSSSFNQIKRKTSFLGADLRDADLKGFDLNGIDLISANLKGADLKETNLDKAILSDANLWGANLQMAKLRESILHRADLSWANLNEADLKKANLNGAILNDTKLKKANLNEIEMEWAISRHAFYNESILINANLTGTDLAKSNFSKANLSKANLKLVNLSETILNQTNLSNVELAKGIVHNKDWIQKLKEWQVSGSAEIKANFKIVDDVTEAFDFRIEKK